jgi:uncharacterized protein (DUF58 family)
MDHATLQQARNAALDAAARLRLPLRSRSWHGQAGEFSGSGTGSSLDFQDHRAYSPGDDPRHINWQAYARTGSYTMKLFREEVRPQVDLILDASESMWFDPAKARRTAELLYFISEGCAASGASLQINALRGDTALRLDPADLRAHHWLERIKQTDATGPATAPDLTKATPRANSIRVLISDLLFPADPEPLLHELARRRGSVIVFSPWLASEARPSWDGHCELIDVERGSRHPHRIEAATLRRYRESYDNHFSWWANACRRHQAAFARIDAEGGLTTNLFRDAVPAGALEACT